MKSATQYQVQAKYLGYIDLGAAAFAVPLSAINPKATVKNQIIFRSNIGDEFAIGETYAVRVKISGDRREFDVIGKA